MSTRLSRDSFNTDSVPNRGTEAMRDQRATVGPQEWAKKEKRLVILFCPLIHCVTAHLCDQGNTGASGLPGLVGFPGVGIQGEKVRPTQLLASASFTGFQIMMFLWL